MRRVAAVILMLLMIALAGTLVPSRADDCLPTNPPSANDGCCPGGWEFQGCELEPGTDVAVEVYYCPMAVCETYIRRPAF